MPGCCDCVRFHNVLRLFKNCHYVLFLQISIIHSTKQHKTRVSKKERERERKEEKEKRKKRLITIGREDLANLSRVQPTNSALLLNPQMLVPFQCSTVSRGNKQTHQWYNSFCQEAFLQQRNNVPNTNFLSFCA